MKGRAPLAILCGLALAGAGAATVVAARASGTSHVAAAPEPLAADPPGAKGPGYTLMDLPAIEKAAKGRGKPVLVHFWASWCGPCLEELPVVDKFAREMRARGVEVLSLSLDDPARAGDRVVQVLTRSAPNLTRNIVKVADSDAFVNAIDPSWEGSIPAVFGFDAGGKLRGRLIGEASRRDLDGLVARVAR
ncbi:MAG TPA: TlpA disulfide reductase family protein [Polyangia bacterium]|nr:TlpA disulfide reductase family protein [Polyangia bacterium]